MTFSDIAEILTSVTGVFGLIALGAWCRTRRWLNPQADVSLANLATNVLLPALFLDRILGDPTLESIWQAWRPPLMGFTATAGGFVLAFLLARRFGPLFGLLTDASQRAFALCAGICNYGYVPLPLAQTFYPEAEVELILHNVGVDVALWSVGVAIIAGGGSDAGGGMNPEFRGRRPGFGSLISPPLIAVAVALTLRFSGAGGVSADRRDAADRLPRRRRDPDGAIAFGGDHHRLSQSRAVAGGGPGDRRGDRFSPTDHARVDDRRDRLGRRERRFEPRHGARGGDARGGFSHRPDAALRRRHRNLAAGGALDLADRRGADSRLDRRGRLVAGGVSGAVGP